MAKLPRVTQKIFAENSGNNDITVFGTAKNGNDAVFTKDISQIMNSDAFSQGWGSATLTDDAPFQEDMNGVQLALSQQLAYFFENGIPEWDENTTYFANTSFCQINGIWYQSLTDNNIGNNPTTDTTNWHKIDLNKLESDLSNLTTTGLNKINQSKALETGSVSSDKDVYADIAKYAHSTFDKSKFVVSGNPIITNDGIASGFNTGNFPQTAISINLATPVIEIGFSFTPQANQPFSYVGILSIPSTNSENFVVGYETSKSKSYMSYGIGNVEGSFWNKYGSNNLLPDIKHYLKILIDGLNVNIFVSNDKLNWELDATGTITTPLTRTETLRFGVDRNGQRPLAGTIDLKDVYVKYSNTPVFSGNITGIDTIKPDDYTVVGSPTISADGILSNCSNGNTVNSKVQLSQLKGKSWTIKGSATLGSSNHTLVKLSSSGNGNYTNFGSILWLCSSNIVAFNAKSGVQGDTDNQGSHILSGNNLFNTGDKVYYTLCFDYPTGKYSLYVDKVDGTTLIGNWTPATENKELYYINANPDFYISYGSGSDNNLYLTTGSIDLNVSRIYVEGSLIYQPCLKIPYTQSKTGSKIVDVAYRDRVQDMYEQFGYAPYYTIDEENNDFTLPMGEMYGFYEKYKNSINQISDQRFQKLLNLCYPIGKPVPEQNNELAENEVWLEGAIVNIADYPLLFQKYGTKYGGDAITTFGLPDLRNRTFWGSPDGSIGYYGPGLPNIRGAFTFTGDEVARPINGAAREAFYLVQNAEYSTTLENTGGNNLVKILEFGFNANQYNSVYQDSLAGLVVPNSFKVRFKTRYK